MTVNFKQISDNVYNGYNDGGNLVGVVVYRPEDDRFEAAIRENVDITPKKVRKGQDKLWVVETFMPFDTKPDAMGYVEDNADKVEI